MTKQELEAEFIKYKQQHLGIKKQHSLECIALLHSSEDNSMFKRNCFDKGHFTASTFVVNKDYTKILLMHHIKLDKWQQFGGHADGEVNLLNVAKRELEEESGIHHSEITMSKDILEIDIHKVPKRGIEPEHFHYDVRYLAIVKENVLISKQDAEVHDIAWFDLDDVLHSNDDTFQSSMSYSLKKIQKLRVDRLKK